MSDAAADLALAERVAREAGAAALARFGRLAGGISFKGARDLVTAADLEAEEIVRRRLAAERPADPLLAEEEATSRAGGVAARRAGVLAAERCWVLDPLDGTTNFAHRHPFFAVSLALLERGVPAAGVVHAPALGATFTARAGGGAFENGERVAVSATACLRDAIFATGFPYKRDELSPLENNVLHFQRFILEVRGFRRCGAASLDLAYVASGRYDVFFEAQLEPWDVAAGVLLVREAGGRVSDYRGGEDWLFGKRVLATNGALHEVVRGRLE